MLRIKSQITPWGGGASPFSVCAGLSSRLNAHAGSSLNARSGFSASHPNTLKHDHVAAARTAHEPAVFLRPALCRRHLDFQVPFALTHVWPIRSFRVNSSFKPICPPAQSRVAYAKSETQTRKGFTLVELIVVIVILGILAAIAIPALTGYISKAEWQSFEAEVNTARTAFQTFIIEEMNENGGAIKLYNNNDAPTNNDNPNGHFTLVQDATPPGETDPANKVYNFYTISTATEEDYRQLTGSTANFRANALADGNGTVLMVVLTYLDYYENLVALDTTWTVDFSANDPLGKYVNYSKNSIGDAVYRQKYANLVPGFTCWKLAWKGGVVGPGTGSERVY